MLEGFGTVCKGLGRRTKPYLPQICGTILWRLNNKSAKVRQQATDLVFLIFLRLLILERINSILDCEDSACDEHMPGRKTNGPFGCCTL